MSCVIIPVRDYANTKLRLRGKLNDERRALLTATLLEGVLKAIENSPVEQVIVVASNPVEVERHTHGFSKLLILKESMPRGGVNGAMEDGLRFLKRERMQCNRILMMPSDLPFLDSGTLGKVLELKKSHDLVINGSRKKDGTSLLLLEPSKMIPLRYDDNSFVNHQAEATKRSLNFVVTDFRPLSFDVDDDDDLDLLMKEIGANTFEELIRGLRSMSAYR